MVFTPPPPPAPTGFPTPVVDRRPGAPGIVAVLGLAVVIMVEYAVSVGPWLLLDTPYVSELAGLGLTTVPFLLYLVLVAAVGRSAVRRVVAAGLVATSLTLHVAFWFVVQHAPSARDSLDDVQVLGWVGGAVTGLLLVAAWGISRRTGSVWWIGVLVVPALVAGQALVDDSFSTWVWETASGIDFPGGRWLPVFHVFVWTTWALVPPLAAGVTCWVLDQVAPGRRPR